MRAASTNSRAGRLVEDGPRRADRSAKFISVSGAHLYGGAGKRKMDRPGNYLSTTAETG